jgi:2-polyprenyl-6-methoxyphenol hydroxylase-like FAD-dependent oxidoreductase
MSIDLDSDISTLDPVQAVYRVLGGCLDPFPIKIDQILVTSSWQPNICVVDNYASPKGRVFLSGDAAHQNIPTGGYGMNTALADSFDIGWKVGAVLAGYGGPALLQSYETERRPVAARSIEHASVRWTVHTTVWEWSAKGPIISQAEDGKRLRAWVADFLQQHDGENKDLGIELGHRYTDSPVIVADDGEEPVWAKSHYVPST